MAKGRRTISPHDSINPSPNDSILDWSNFKAFADDKMKVTEKLKSVVGRVETIMGKGVNAGYQHFLPFRTMFSKDFFFKVVQCQDCVVKD